MERVAHPVPHHGFPRVRLQGWRAWLLPALARAFMVMVTCAGLAWAGATAARFTFRVHDLVLFAALLACSAATVELSRRAATQSGGVQDVYAVWELPAAIHLPLLYALVVPAIRLALTQWRVRQAPPWRWAFTAAATGIAYGLASLVFRAVIRPGVYPQDFLASNAAGWLLAAACCALTQWAVSRTLLRTVLRAPDPVMPLRGMLCREPLQNDATEFCAAILVALAIGVSPLTLIVTFPLGTLLQRSSRHAQLLSSSRSDAKTGLLNAAAWEAEATAEVARAVRTGTPLAVALLDLDLFKGINDTYGHLVGDQVLRRIATTMTEVLRDYDLVGRFGGEEFAMLLPQTRAVDALRIAERVRADIAGLPIYASGASGADRVPVTVSIGVAALDAGSHRELAELLAAADAALYRAKASGRDQVQMISTSRGLSAVQLPASGGLFDSGDASGHAEVSAGLAPAGPQPVVAPAGPQPAVGAEAPRSSTATTSALAV
jgi:diguanylate cyclase (GGDEF)-like protein